MGFEETRWLLAPEGKLTVTTSTKLLGPQATLVEVLAAIFITGVGLLALLELFPEGPFSMRAALEAERSLGPPELLDFFGLPKAGDVRYGGRFDLSFPSPGPLLPDAFASPQVLSGDILVSAVPEPATLLLLGSALLVAMLGARRLRRLLRAPRAPWQVRPAGLAPAPEAMLRSRRFT